MPQISYRPSVSSFGALVVGTMSPYFSSSTMTDPANRAYYTKVRVPYTTTLTALRIIVGTQSGNIDVGIYDSTGTGGNPGARLASSGSTACPAVSTAAVSINLTASTTIAPGDYWFAYAADNGTVAIAGFDSNKDLGLAKIQDTAFPLPATATAAATSITRFYGIWI